MEHIESILSLEHKLYFDSIHSIRILSDLEVIAKNNNKKFISTLFIFSFDVWYWQFTTIKKVVIKTLELRNVFS